VHRLEPFVEEGETKWVCRDCGALVRPPKPNPHLKAARKKLDDAKSEEGE
jgi:hypothetical protein